MKLRAAAKPTDGAGPGHLERVFAISMAFALRERGRQVPMQVSPKWSPKGRIRRRKIRIQGTRIFVSGQQGRFSSAYSAPEYTPTGKLTFKIL